MNSIETKSIQLWCMEKDNCIKQEALWGWVPQQISTIESYDDGWENVIQIDFIRRTDYLHYQELCELEARYQDSTKHTDFAISLAAHRAHLAANALWPKLMGALGIGIAWFGLCVHELSIAFTIVCIISGILIYIWNAKKISSCEKDEKMIREQVHGQFELSQMEIDDIIQQAAAYLSD